MIEEKTIKRGEVWYIEQPSNNPAAAGMGRPAVVLSNDKGCAVSPEISVVYVTTNTYIAKNRENVKLSSLRRESVAKCAAIPPIPRSWFKEKMCDLTDEEMLKIEEAVSYAFSFVRKEDNSMEGRKELEFYKFLYQEALRELAKKQLAEDLAALTKPEPVVVDEPEEDVPVEIEGPVDINAASFDELRALGFSANICLSIIAGRPYTKIDDLQIVPGMTAIAFQMVENKIAVGSETLSKEQQMANLRKEEPKKSTKKKSEGKPKVMRRVNINTANAYELMSKFGLGEKTAATIIQRRNKVGKFTSMEDIAAIPRMGKANMKKLQGRIIFG